MIQALLAVVAPIVGRVVNSYFPNPEDQLKAQQLQNELSMEIIRNSSQIEQAAAAVVKSEAESKHWITAAWRPITMLTFVTIIANNYLLVPWLQVFGLPAVSLPIPPDMWTLLQIGLGGYIVGRSSEKVAEKVAETLKR